MKERRGWKGARYQDEGSGQEASKVFNIKVEFAYLNSDYDLVLLQGNEITGQGLLLCGKLKPKKPLLPEFLIRWDEKGDHLNVDIKHDKKCQDDWKNEKHGYKGHQPQKASDRPGRAFSLLIRTPDLKVFEGVISFNLARGVKAAVILGLHVSADVHSSKW